MNVSFAHLSSLINIFFLFLSLLQQQQPQSSKTRRAAREPKPVSWPFHACSCPPLHTSTHLLPRTCPILLSHGILCASLECMYLYLQLMLRVSMYVNTLAVCVYVREAVCRCRLRHVANSVQRANVIALLSTLHQKNMSMLHSLGLKVLQC